MLKTTRVFNFELKVWWYIFLVLQIIIIALVIGTVLAESWVKTKNIESCSYIYFEYTDYYETEYDANGDYTYFCGEFEGTILKCVSGCKDSYQKHSNDWCSVMGDNDYPCIGCEDYRDETLCHLFTKLYFAQWFFIAVEIVVIFSISVWIMGLFCYPKVPECFPVGFYSTFVGCLSQILGVLAWLGITGAGFGDDCKSLGDNGDLPTLCATDGPKLAIATAIFMSITVVLYHVVVCIAKKKEKQSSMIAQNSGYSGSISSQRQFTGNDNYRYADNSHSQPSHRAPQMPIKKTQIPPPPPKSQPKPKMQNPEPKKPEAKNPLPSNSNPEANPLNPPNNLQSCNVPFIPKNPTEFDNDIDAKMKALPELDDIISKITSAAKLGKLPKGKE